MRAELQPWFRAVSSDEKKWMLDDPHSTYPTGGENERVLSRRNFSCGIAWLELLFQDTDVLEFVSCEMSRTPENASGPHTATSGKISWAERCSSARQCEPTHITVNYRVANGDRWSTSASASPDSVVSRFCSARL